MGNRFSPEPKTQSTIELGALFGGITGAAISALVAYVTKQSSRDTNAKLRALDEAKATSVEELQKTLEPLGSAFLGKMNVNMREEDQNALLMNIFTSQQYTNKLATMVYRLSSQRHFIATRPSNQGQNSLFSSEQSHNCHVYLSPIVLRDLKTNQPLFMVDLPLHGVFGPKLTPYKTARRPNFEFPTSMLGLKTELLGETDGAHAYELHGNMTHVGESSGVTREFTINDEVLPFEQNFFTVGKFSLDSDGECS